jgi:CelD/BcsL family acetyltransferase involved in cellulose biosynthesis
LRCLDHAATAAGAFTLTTVTEINQVDALDSLRLVWQHLHCGTRRPSFFQSLDWLVTYWRHFAQDQRLRVLVVHSGGHPLGIVPLAVKTERRRVGSVRTLTYPLDSWGTFYGPIGPNPAASLWAAFRHIRQTPRDWDLIELPWVAADGADHGRTQNALRLAGLAVSREPWQQVAQIDLTGTWQAYWKGRDQDFCRNVERLERRLGRSGNVQYLRYRPAGTAHGDDDPRWDLYDACVQVAEASWQGDSTDGNTLNHEPVRDFLRDAHVAAVRAGALDLNLLLVDHRPVAFMYDYHCRGQCFGLRTGYTAAAARDGVGSILMRRKIEDSFARGDRQLDIGAEGMDWKRRWLTSVETSYRLTHYPPRALRGQLIRAKRWLVGAEKARQAG